MARIEVEADRIMARSYSRGGLDFYARDFQIVADPFRSTVRLTACNPARGTYETIVDARAGTDDVRQIARTLAQRIRRFRYYSGGKPGVKLNVTLACVTGKKAMLTGLEARLMALDGINARPF